MLIAITSFCLITTILNLCLCLKPFMLCFQYDLLLKHGFYSSVKHQYIHIQHTIKIHNHLFNDIIVILILLVSFFLLYILAVWFFVFPLIFYIHGPFSCQINTAVGHMNGIFKSLTFTK